VPRRGDAFRGHCSGAQLRDRRGVLEWSFDAKPGEVRDINFAWRVRWPKDKSMVIVPSG
jgi:hypothetical protein